MIYTRDKPGKYRKDSPEAMQRRNRKHLSRRIFENGKYIGMRPVDERPAPAAPRRKLQKILRPAQPRRHYLMPLPPFLPEGYLYFFENPKYPNHFKGGGSNDPETNRLTQANTWDLESGWRLFAYKEVADYVASERELKKHPLRVVNKEFYDKSILTLLQGWTIVE